MSPSSLSSDKNGRSNNRHWQSAQERVLLYLRLLNVPGVEALEIALEALVRAKADPEVGENRHPTAAAMHALRILLESRKAEGTHPPRAENRFSSICPWSALLEQAGAPEDAKSMPPLNRGFMTPERL